jgi:hypothetical protein
VLASEIRELLPTHLLCADWHLAYSPRVHSASIQTFYRNQIGPNLIVVRDAHGGVFGGFVTQPWRPERNAYGEVGESFLFASKTGVISASELAAGESNDCVSATALQVFWASPSKTSIIQWTDNKMLGLGHAIVLYDDFLRGSSRQDETFGCAEPLSPAGTDFVVRDFECWHVGGERDFNTRHAKCPDCGDMVLEATTNVFGRCRECREKDSCGVTASDYERVWH